MNKIDELFQQIDAEVDISELRRNIADLIINELGQLGENKVGYWEKLYFANAISALARNVNSTYQPTSSWLILCLVDIEKALVPSEKRDESYVPRNSQIDSISFTQLVEEIRNVKRSC